MPPPRRPRARRYTLTAWLALGGALLACGLLAASGHGAAQAEEGATETPVEAAPSETAVSETPATETPLPEPSATSTVVFTETWAAPSDTPSDTPESSSPTPSPTESVEPTQDSTATPTLSATVEEASSTATLEAETPSPTSTLEAPPSADSTFTFTNGGRTKHNVSFYEKQGGKAFVEGPFIDGGASSKVSFKTPSAGSYFFQCDLHPTEMTGTLVVKDGAPVPGAAPVAAAPAASPAAAK